MIASLPALLAPHDPALFHAAIRERRRVHLRTANADLFRALLPWSVFNGLLGSDRLLDDRTRMVRRGRDLPREMWSYVGPDLKRVVLPDQLQRFCQEGLSIALNQVHQAVPALSALITMLEQALPARIQTNLYASFGRESAFRAHYDPHDALVLHLHGRKRWFCHGHRPDACAKSTVIPDEHLAPVQWESVLEPGDILYIPRGEVHHASVEGEASLHLTNSLLWPRGSDLLKWLAGNGMAGVDVDPDIPVYGSAADMDRYERDLRALFQRLADTVDLRSFLASFTQERRVRQPFNLGLSTDLEPDCWVQPLPSPDVPLPSEGDASISFNGGRVTLDPQERAVLAALLTEGARQIADLPLLSGLDMETVRAAVSSLARRSLVLLVES
jgi:Cupin superfamily protein